MAEILRQAYDEMGCPIAGNGLTKAESFSGILHGAAHVWIWRRSENGLEILLQTRSMNKVSWRGLHDVSAAGHIDLDESPHEAAIREPREEIGLEIDESGLISIGTYRAYMVMDNGLIENEFQWLYLYELKENVELTLEESEVESVAWRSLAVFMKDIENGAPGYVPHGKVYFSMLCEALDAVTK